MVEVQEQVRQPLRIEVFPAGSDTPVLIKEKNFDYKPASATSSIVPIDRANQFPANLPPKQKAQFEQQYKPKPTTQPKVWQTLDAEIINESVKVKRVSPLINTEGGQALGSFINGLIDEFRDSSAEHAYQTYGHLQDESNASFYDIGRLAAEPLEKFFDNAFDWTENELNNIWDDLKDNLKNPPDFQIPLPKIPSIEFELPNIELPKIEFPNIGLPEINLPELDFDIKNPYEEAQKEKEEQEESDRRKEEEEKNKPTIDQLFDLLNNYPDNCFFTVFLVSHQYRTYESRRDYEYSGTMLSSGKFKETPWSPGSGRVAGVPSNPDMYGNTFNRYPSGGGVGYSLYYNFDVSIAGNDELDGNNTICLVKTAHATIFTTVQLPDNTYRSATPYDWFSVRREDGTLSRVIEDFGTWGIDGFSIECPMPPNKSPYLNNNPPRIPPEPPINDNDNNKGDDTMACCDCNAIANVMRSVLKSMKYNITIPVVSCEYDSEKKEWESKVDYQNIEIFAVDSGVALSQAKLYQELAMQAREICESKNIVNKASNILGVDDYPISIPESFIKKGDGLVGDLISNNNKEVENVSRLICWYVERFDEIMGQFEIPIEIKDTDPTKPGDQSKMMRFPNVAETLAEAMMLLMQLSINSELHTNIITRILVEAGQDKKQNFITYKSVETLIDYLGYKVKNKEVKLPLMFTPDKTGYEEILKECQIPVSVAEYDEKLSLQADLMRFREAAAILKANNFVKLDPNQDIKTQIMERLLNLNGLMKDTTSEKPDDNFDEFLNAVEQGFTNTPGVGDPTKPYGRPYEDRPRIRRIKKVDAEDRG